VRDNVRAGSSGLVIGTETKPTKAAAARANLFEADLAELVDVREGDATETLGKCRRPGAIVMADNVPKNPRGYRGHIDYIRNPANGFRSMLVDFKGGLEISVRDR